MEIGKVIAEVINGWCTIVGGSWPVVTGNDWSCGRLKSLNWLVTERLDVRGSLNRLVVTGGSVGSWSLNIVEPGVINAWLNWLYSGCNWLPDVTESWLVIGNSPGITGTWLNWLNWLDIGSWQVVTSGWLGTIGSNVWLPPLCSWLVCRLGRNRSLWPGWALWIFW